MPYYLVTKPCKYVADGKPHYHRVGDVVELDDHVAGYLVRRLKATKAPKKTVEEKYGALASYVDPLLLSDQEQTLRETDPELKTESNPETSEKGKS